MHCGIYIQCSVLCMNTALFVKYTVIDYICIPESKSIVQQLSAEYKKSCVMAAFSCECSLKRCRGCDAEVA